MWNRAALRPEPVRATHSTDLTRVPEIRQINACGSEEGEVSAAVASEAASSGHSDPAESVDSAPTSSLSVREQLLNALRKQREATVGAPPLVIPGSLTMMNSPTVPSQRAAAAHLPESPIETSGEVPVESPLPVHSESSFLTSPANTARSPIGLTRTLEADLQSADPFVRNRAQRLLRLEMQILKLKANQAADAEHSTQHAGPHLSEPAAEHAPEPSTKAISRTPSAVRHKIPDEHAANHSSANAVTSEEQPDEHGHRPAEESEIVHPQDDAPVKSPHTSMIENIVVDGPIDRLGLANNLFAVGQYPLALEMYQQTATADLTAQQHFWVEYQTANCLRRLGNPTEASNRYRKLAEHPEAGWLSQQAHWWVETLEKIRSLEQALADNALDQHRAALEEVEKATLHIQNRPAAQAPGQSLQKESTHDASDH